MTSLIQRLRLDIFESPRYKQQSRNKQAEGEEAKEQEMAYYKREGVVSGLGPPERFKELTGVDPENDPFRTFVLDLESGSDLSFFKPSKPLGTFVGHPARVPCFAQHMFVFSVGVKSSDEEGYVYNYEIQKKVLTYVLQDGDEEMVGFCESNGLEWGPSRHPSSPDAVSVLIVPCCEVTDPRGHRWTRMYSFVDAVKEVLATVVSEYPSCVFQYTTKYLGGIQFKSGEFLAEQLASNEVFFPRFHMLERCHMSSVLNSIVVSSPPEAPLTPPSPRATSTEERLFFTTSFRAFDLSFGGERYEPPQAMRFERVDVPIICGCIPSAGSARPSQTVEGVEVGKRVFLPVSLKMLIPVLADHVQLVLNIDDDDIDVYGFASLDARFRGEVRKLRLACVSAKVTVERTEAEFLQALKDAEDVINTEKRFASFEASVNLAQ